MSNYLQEGSEKGDLHRLVQPILSIDEFRSKMGEDKDIVVFGFTVFGKDPATDLVNFVEKSYDWVLDADLSSGETNDGNYVVFIEVERTPKVIEQVMTLMEDLMNLTDQELEDWSFTFYNKPDKHPVTKEELSASIITTSQEYENKISDDLKEGARLNSLRALAGVTVKPSIIKDMEILNMQSAAGIR